MILLHQTPQHPRIGDAYIRTLRSSAYRLRKLCNCGLDQRCAAALTKCVEQLEREAAELEFRKMLRKH